MIAELPGTRVVLVAASDDPGMVRDAMEAGIQGYVTKDTPLAQLISTIWAVLADQVVVPHSLASAAAGARSPEERNAVLVARQLTERERDVLILLARGKKGSRIAQELSISPNTVRTHVQNILTKLQVHSRLEAVAFAARHGLVDISSTVHADNGGREGISRLEAKRNQRA
jgi:two-component system nitrate/nitrite response regulator NarL